MKHPGETAPLSREEELLVLCARVAPEARAVERIEALLREGPDWDALESRAAALGVAPLAARHFAAPGLQGLVPPATLSRLGEAHRLQAVRSLRLLGHAGRILDALREAGVETILLKGALLAGSLYPDPALRPMSDLDLLCRPEAAVQAARVLASLGFHPDPAESKSAVHGRLAEELSNHLPPFSNGRGVVLELHHRLFPGIPGAAEVVAALWGRAVEHKWQGRHVRGLGAEDQLAYLAYHLHRHLAGDHVLPIYWWTDLHELLLPTRPSPDWDRFLALVESLGTGEATGAVLATLREHWGTPVPERVLARLGAGATPVPLAAVLRGVGMPALRLRSRADIVRRLALAGGSAAVASYLFRAVWPSRAFITERYRLGDRRVTPYRIHFAGSISLRWLRTALLHAVRRPARRRRHGGAP